jgi:hypothetical protein
MSGFSYPLHYDTITLEEYREHRVGDRRPALQLDGRSIDERREARWLNTDWTGKGSDL